MCGWPSDELGGADHDGLVLGAFTEDEFAAVGVAAATAATASAGTDEAGPARAVVHVATEVSARARVAEAEVDRELDHVLVDGSFGIDPGGDDLVVGQALDLEVGGPELSRA